MTFLITPLIFLVHIAEEWAHFPAWATRHFGATSRAWYVYSHIFLIAATVGICLMATLAPTKIWIILAVAVQFALFTNAVFHFMTWRIWGEYSPGLYSAMLLFVPVTLWQFAAVPLDAGALAKTLILGSIMGGLAVASLWLNMNIGWNFRACERVGSA